MPNRSARITNELWNSLTHGLGVVLSLSAGAVLITLAAVWGDAWRLASAVVFAVSLLMLYTASTLYHAISHEQAKARMKVIDHCAIYVLIAGTYTPFTLIGLRNQGGWGMFAVVWCIALVGILFKLKFTGRFKGLSTLLYLAMGWMVLWMIEPLRQVTTAATLYWLFAGGAAYSLGTLFYMRDEKPLAHAVWHLFVLLGSVCHFVAVSLHVLQN
jgi:hemolysin III